MPFRLLTAAIVLVAALVITPTSALADHVTCGDVITTNTTLDADVVCPPDAIGVTAPDGQRYAILIGADGVRLDLAGHRIVVQESIDVSNRRRALGIYGHSRVTIANGELTETLILRDAHNNRLVDLKIKGFIGGLVLNGSRSNEIRRVAAYGEQGTALIRDESDENTFISNNFGTDNGLQVRNSDRNLFLHNASCSSTSAFWLGPGSDDNRLEGNVAGCEAGQGRYGFQIADGAHRTVLVDNTANAVGSIAGIFAGDATTVLISNTANDNAGLGILAVPGVFARNNRASGNGDPRQCVEVVCR